jgi:hypothetical protein
MLRPISGYHLECGHNQHIRHDPPWQERAWVTTEAGRQAHLGWQLQCLKCDRGAAPDF